MREEEEEKYMYAQQTPPASYLGILYILYKCVIYMWCVCVCVYEIRERTNKSPVVTT